MIDMIGIQLTLLSVVLLALLPAFFMVRRWRYSFLFWNGVTAVVAVLLCWDQGFNWRHLPDWMPVMLFASAAVSSIRSWKRRTYS